jgi:hypothetical protein
MSPKQKQTLEAIVRDYGARPTRRNTVQKLRLWTLLGRNGDVDVLHAECCEQLKCKGKAELALVHAVDKHLHIYVAVMSVVRLKLACQFFVRHVLLFAKVFDQGLGLLGIEVGIAGSHRRSV